MNKTAAAAIYLAFYGCVAFCVYWLRSGWPMFALLLTPTIKTKDDDK